MAVVFYSPHAVKIKKLEAVTYEQIAGAFNRDDLLIYTDPEAFKDYLFGQGYENATLLLMSSGNYGGLDLEAVIRLIQN